MKNLWLESILWIYAMSPVVGIAVAFILFKFEFIIPETILDRSLFGMLLAGMVLSFWGAIILCKVMSLRCPKCNSVLHPFTKFFTFEFVGKKCRNCGYDLRGRDSDSQHRS